MLQKAKKKHNIFVCAALQKSVVDKPESMHFPIKLMTPYDIL